MAHTNERVNPFDTLIGECNNDPVKLQARYETHRTNRDKQQHDLLLSPSFKGVNIDETLRSLLKEEKRQKIFASENNGDLSPTEYQDDRINLCFRTRPPPRIRELITLIQKQIETVVPNMWFAPWETQHITTLEIAYCQTEASIAPHIAALRPLFEQLLNQPRKPGHRPRLLKPMLVFDASAVALSFLPAAGEPRRHGDSFKGVKVGDDSFSYHHLRRDLYDIAATAVELTPRYIYPSCHITLARFVEDVEQADVQRLVALLDEINETLKTQYWSSPSSNPFPADSAKDEKTERVKGAGEWTVGEDVAMDVVSGPCWYGVGWKLHEGRPFKHD